MFQDFGFLVDQFSHIFTALGSEQAFFAWFSQFAYHPNLVYLIIIIFMLASSFGLPIPEEITLLSTGLVAFMGKHPDLYPPPYPGAIPVDVTTAAYVAFFSVFGSDLLVFSLGKYFGVKITKKEFFKKFISEESMVKINGLAHKYSYWVCGIFRFTPGLRFPGHLSCGMTGISYTKFIIIDGLAALFSVPTQILLVAHYGEHIISYVKKFNLFIAVTVAIIIIWFAVKKWMQYRQEKKLNS
jgi:membrane protein DedA with SNARE-associated domain